MEFSTATASTRIAQVTDGLSNTLAVGKHGRRNSRATWVGSMIGTDEGPSLIPGDSGTPPNSPQADDDDFSSGHARGELPLRGMARSEPLATPFKRRCGTPRRRGVEGRLFRGTDTESIRPMSGFGTATGR